MERVQKPQTPIHQPQEGDLCGQDRHITAVPFALAWDKLGGRCQAQGQDHGHAQLGSTVDDRVNARTNAGRNHRTPQRGLSLGQVATDPTSLEPPTPPDP